MIIVHKIGDFLFDLFPNAKKATDKIEALTQSIKEFYTYRAFVPKVSIEANISGVSSFIDLTRLDIYSCFLSTISLLSTAP